MLYKTTEGDKSTKRRSSKQKNAENKNLMHRIGERPKKKLCPFPLVAMPGVQSESVGKEKLWHLLSADDLRISRMAEDRLQRRVVEWEEALERKLCEKKAEIMACTRGVKAEQLHSTGSDSNNWRHDSNVCRIGC